MNIHILIYHIHFCVCAPAHAGRHKNNIQKEKNSEEKAVKRQEPTFKGYRLIVAFVERKRVAHTNTAL